MKEYFFLTGKDQNGPFTIEQLADKGLTNETLIWTEGMENWQKLKDIPELAQTLRPKSVPPPPPDTDEKIFKTEVSGQLKVTTEKTPNPALEAIKPSKTTLVWLITWCGFHLFALLMSYSQVKIFNNQGTDTKKFWPIVEYQRCYPKKKYVQGQGYWDKGTPEHTMTFLGETWKIPAREPQYHDNGHYEYDGEECYFNGLFNKYDWTEFALYVGGAMVIYLLVRISNKDDEKKINNVESNERNL
jgi:hypothetical protein